MVRVPLPRRSEIWLVQFNPSVGAEMQKLRPAVVVNLDAVGKLALRIVAPLTDWQSSFEHRPWFTAIPASKANGLIKDSGADAFQVKSVSTSRFVRRIGKITDAQINEIAVRIAHCVGAPVVE